MKHGFKTKAMSMLLAGSMVIGATSALTGCSSKSSNETITLDVYSQLANYSGLQTGWMADVLKEKFNVKINIIPDSDGVYETRTENGDLGDIIIWGGTIDQYSQAIKNGLLYNLEEDDLLKEEAPYINEHMQDALEKNRRLNSSITDGKDKNVYGWGNVLATSAEDHQAFLYTWDTRWDLYKELGYPKINNLEEFKDMLRQMQKMDPKDDSGNKTYAVSLWPDWDDTMVMYVKSTATAYYGYDEMGMGLYDPETGKYYDALQDDGPYLEMLKWYNDLYQEGLLDPDSMTQTYDKMVEKVQNGGVLFSIFNYSGQMAFNKKKHLEDGQYMYCMKPEEASPIVYGMSTLGGDYITTIGAKSDYPELCMEILNYFCTPEGFMTMTYGPKDECWYYDDEGYTHFTELGEACSNNTKTKMEKHKGSFGDGQMQMAVSTWATDAKNPDSNGETYNCMNWKSRTDSVLTEIEEDWRTVTGAESLDDYFEQREYTLAPSTDYMAGTKSDELAVIWKQVAEEIKASSWKAIYADSDAKFDSIVAELKKKAKSYGYDKCIEWCLNEAKLRKEQEDLVMK